MKTFLKTILHAVFLTIAFPLALTSGFGRIESLFRFWAHNCALVPGLPGDYLRTAYYRLTLEECSLDSRMDFGSFFAHPQARVARGVYIGCNCLLGRTSIGERTQIASGVQILSGGQQHPRDAEGQIMGAEHGVFRTIRIGADCWIGAGSIVLADVGNRATLGAGSVVVYPVPGDSVAVGNPARVVRNIHQRPA